jgi:hypothetical protein
MKDHIRQELLNTVVDTTHAAGLENPDIFLEWINELSEEELEVEMEKLKAKGLAFKVIDEVSKKPRWCLGKEDEKKL